MVAQSRMPDAPGCDMLAAGPHCSCKFQARRANILLKATMARSRSARMSWTAWVGILVLLPLAVIGFGAWYALAVPGKAHQGPLPAATAEERDIAARLRTHVTAVASVPHNVQYYEALERAAQHIEQRAAGAGLCHRAAGLHRCRPLGAQHRGDARAQDRRRRGTKTLVLGAHYDSFENAPGANDNGTGVGRHAGAGAPAEGLAAGAGRASATCCSSTRSRPTSARPTWAAGAMPSSSSERGEKVRGMISLETHGLLLRRAGLAGPIRRRSACSIPRRQLRRRRRACRPRAPSCTR